MIFVTGDVHDMAMGGPDQACLREQGKMTEMDCAVKFADMAAESGVAVTLFVTGRAAQEEPAALGRLVDNPYVEVGGHTWNGLQPPWKHVVRERMHGSYYGRYEFQRRDIVQTLEVIERQAGIRPISWRTHAYRGDATTNRILDEVGCRVVSDTVAPSATIQQVGESLLSLPINTPPDHEHLYHGRFTPEWRTRDALLRRRPWTILTHQDARPYWKRALKEVGKRVLGVHTPAKPFGDVYVHQADWWSWVEAEMTARLAEAGFATLLLHPACMEVLDGMASLATILQKVGRDETACVATRAGGFVG